MTKTEGTESTTVPEVDYAALIAGSNADVLPVSDNTIIESSDLGDDQDVDEEADVIDHDAEGDDGEGKAIDQPAVTPTKKQAAATTVVAGTKDLVAKQLEKEFGKSVTLPADATDESALEFYKAQHGPKKLHPEVARFEAALNAGLKPEDYFKAYSALDDRLNMDDHSLVKTHLKDLNGKSEAKPKGWDDATIDGMVKSMENGGTLPLKALEVRNALEASKAQRQKDAEQYATAGRPNMADPAVIAEFEQNVTASVDAMSKAGDGKLYGLDLTAQGGKEAIAGFLKTYVKVDPKTGLSPFTSELQSNDEFLKAALLYNMAKKGAIKGMVAATSEKTKAAYLKSLGLTPPKGGGNSAGSSAAADFAAFMEPSGLTERKAST